MGAGRQPRGKLSPLLVAEFKHKVLVTSTEVIVPKVITDLVPPPFQGVPLHAKLISSRTEVALKGDKGEKQVQISEFGVYRTPDEFIEFASGLQHPLDSPQVLEPANLRAMLAIRDWPASEVVAFRASNLRKYTNLAVKLMDEEKQLRETMDPQVNDVAERKALGPFPTDVSRRGCRGRYIVQ